MKLLILAGLVLIGYAILLTPAFIEPSDIIQSSLIITGVYALYGELWGSIIVPLWMATGYLALVWGFVLVGHSIKSLRGLHNKTSIIIHHPFKVTGVVFAITLIITLVLLYQTGQL
jgi:hypothetical protein